MHHALEISELQERIVSFAGSSALFHLAQTSKIFTGIALQRLYKISSINEKTFPALVHATLPLGLGKESEIPSAEDCVAFLRIARKTEKVQFHVLPPEFWNIPWFITRDTSLLFTNLRTLVLTISHDDDWFPAIKAFLPASLKTLEMRIRHLGNPRSVKRFCVEQQGEFLQFLAERPKQESFSLTEFTWDGFENPLDEENAHFFTIFMRTQHELETISVGQVPLDLWPHLATLRNLRTLALNDCFLLPEAGSGDISIKNVEKLHVGLLPDNSRPENTHSIYRVRFTHVHNLKVRAPWDYLPSIAQAVHESGIMRVTMGTFGRDELSMIYDFFSSLHSDTSSNSLREMSMYTEDGTADPILFSTIQPILRFPLIGHLNLDFRSGMDLCDQDISLLADSLTNLEDIFIVPAKIRPRTTFYGLSHFAKCPLLQKIVLGLLPILPHGVKIPAMIGSSVHTIHGFDRGFCSEDEFNVEDVVPFIEAVFPHLEYIACAYDYKVHAKCKSWKKPSFPLV
ncbi:hypothetical protein DL96DRAFT_1560181 [Flagelloscypha sp. PMI_526]|nr:hypothetical protein DL96DRAFT_1560181 [Flagelloscypha sp. PMI_526]